MADIERDMKDTLASRPSTVRTAMPVVAPPPPNVTEALAVTTGKRVQPEAHDRIKEHGDYEAAAALTQTLKDWMRDTPNWSTLSPGKKQSLEMIATKIGRILHGDPNYADHWEDTAGYARLGLKSR